MVFYNENETEKMVIDTCNCGCGSVFHITRTTDDPEEYYISLHSSNWYSESTSAWDKFKTKMKRLWCVLRNKEYLYMDVCLTPQEFKEFTQKLEELQK